MEWFKPHKKVDEVPETPDEVPETPDEVPETPDEVPETPVEEINVQVEGDIEFTSIEFNVYYVYLQTKSNLKITYSTSDYIRSITLDNIKYLDAVEGSRIEEHTWLDGKVGDVDDLAYDIAIKELRKFITERDGFIMEELKRKIKLEIISDIEAENLEDKKMELKSLSKQEIKLSFKFTK